MKGIKVATNTVVELSKEAWVSFRSCLTEHCCETYTVNRRLNVIVPEITSTVIRSEEDEFANDAEMTQVSVALLPSQLDTCMEPLTLTPSCLNQGLCDAAEKGDAKELARLLATQHGISCINNMDEYGWGVPLHYAVDSSNLDVVKLLLDKGAYVDMIGEGGTPLALAAMKGNNQKALFLIQKGASKEKAVRSMRDIDKAMVKGFITKLPPPPSVAPPGLPPSRAQKEEAPKPKKAFLKKGRGGGGGLIKRTQGDSSGSARSSLARPSTASAPAPPPPSAPVPGSARPSTSSALAIPQRLSRLSQTTKMMMGALKQAMTMSSSEPAERAKMEGEKKEEDEQAAGGDDDDNDDGEGEEEEEEEEQEKKEELNDEEKKTMAEDLCDAAQKGAVEELARLLSTRGGISCINSMNQQGYTPLHWAVYHSKLEATRLLVDKGADVEATCKDDCLLGTPLGIAAWKGYASISRHLLAKGASRERAVEFVPESVRALVEGFLVDLGRLSQLRPELEAKRQQIQASGLISDKPQALPTTTKGITIAGLRKIKAVVQAECEGGRFEGDRKFPDGTLCKGTTRFSELTTTDVVYRYVKDSSVTGDLRLADSGLLDRDFFRVPSLFVSHAWKGSFAVLVDQVIAHAEKQGFSDDYCVWMDMWAINQHSSKDCKQSSRKQNQEDVAAFQDVLQTCLDGTLVVCDFEKCETQTRAWCLFEWDW